VPPNESRQGHGLDADEGHARGPSPDPPGATASGFAGRAGHHPLDIGRARRAGSDYARGWTIGYFSLIAYAVAYAVLALLGWFARRGQLASGAQLAGRLAWVALAAFVVAQLWAWVLISK